MMSPYRPRGAGWRAGERPSGRAGLARDHGVHDLRDAVGGECRVNRASGPEGMLGVPAVDQGLQAPAPLPEPDGGRRGDGPRAARRVSVQRREQRAAGATEPCRQRRPLARGGGRLVAAVLIGHGDRRPHVAPPQMVGEVVQRPAAAVLDSCRQVPGQARLERAELAAQVVQVSGKVHETGPYTPGGLRPGRGRVFPRPESLSGACARLPPWRASDCVIASRLISGGCATWAQAPIPARGSPAARGGRWPICSAMWARSTSTRSSACGSAAAPTRGHLRAWAMSPRWSCSIAASPR